MEYTQWQSQTEWTHTPLLMLVGTIGEEDGYEIRVSNTDQSLILKYHEMTQDTLSDFRL